ncbi:ABC transporter permease [Acidiferrimicrobium sp. IK]|uniref:ABC transporter permease n=1 Tax=Acidiferrimicrobium sp. IK TaxID=2871700 RepID=UPI0021CB0334|nr:ABC transporter permease [Acidiferrimicrobium sp. IK]MCU4187496.1 ABC transporter permease [Acidiferrimicrobium sp. IK]
MDRTVWFGGLAIFISMVLATVPVVLLRHRREVSRLLIDVTFGKRLLAVAASTILVVFLLSAFLGIQIGLEGYQGLQVIGLTALSGLIAAYGNTRELVPLITAFGVASQIGSKFTAELGAMRISDEIDALDVMAVPPLVYLVTPRVIAAVIAVVPLYLLSLSGAYYATQLTVSLLSHEGSGTYLHYFHAYLHTRDIVESTAKVIIFAIAIVFIHSYYGFTAAGGPEGVGRAAGRAIRTSIVFLSVSDLLLTMLFYGVSSNAIRLSG